MVETNTRCIRYKVVKRELQKRSVQIFVLVFSFVAAAEA
jgi:hypothetical protein